MLGFLVRFPANILQLAMGHAPKTLSHTELYSTLRLFEMAGSIDQRKKALDSAVENLPTFVDRLEQYLKNSEIL